MRLVNFVKRLINISYIVLALGILVATLLLDKCISSNLFPNEARWANGGYYLFALIALVLCICAGTRIKKKCTKKMLYITIAGIALMTFVLQLVVTLWAPEVLGSDFETVRNMAINLAEGGSFKGDSYFAKFPNQVHLTILLSWIHKLGSSWRLVIFMGALAANVSAVLMALTIYNATKDAAASIIMCILGEVVFALSWRAFMPYTDIWGMPFAIGALFILSSKLRMMYKLPLLVLLIMIGAWIKITVLIIGLAAFIYYVLYVIKEKSKAAFKLISKEMAVAAALCIVIVSVGGVLSSALEASYEYEKNEGTVGLGYFFLIGQNNDNTGQINSADASQKLSQITAVYTSRDERMAACAKTALSWIYNRGFWGNVKFYTKVLCVCFNDGRFHNVQPYDHSTATHNLIYELYSNDGKLYPVVTELLQIIWDFALLLLTLGFIAIFVMGYHREKHYLFELIMLGIVAYLFIFEDRSKYLFMFLPVIMCFAGIIFFDLKRLYNKVYNVIKELEKTVND